MFLYMNFHESLRVLVATLIRYIFTESFMMYLHCSVFASFFSQIQNSETDQYPREVLFPSLWANFKFLFVSKFVSMPVLFSFPAFYDRKTDIGIQFPHSMSLKYSTNIPYLNYLYEKSTLHSSTAPLFPPFTSLYLYFKRNIL